MSIHSVCTMKKVRDEPFDFSKESNMLNPNLQINNRNRDCGWQLLGKVWSDSIINARIFSYRTNLITAILYGGRENYREQLNRLRNGCHILIATPGRLIDVLEQVNDYLEEKGVDLSDKNIRNLCKYKTQFAHILQN